MIDVHFHDIPDFYRKAVADAGRGPALSSGLPQWSVESALEVMDRNGIATAITSISAPGLHFGDDGAARRLARQCNEFKAGYVATRPARFGAFAALPLPDVAGSLAEISYALDQLELDGVGVYTSYGDRYLGDAFLDPVFDVLNQREAVVFVHPIAGPGARAVSLDLPLFMLEYVFETTRAATNLIYSGTLDRFPKIRFILAHAGGTLPFLAFRIAHSPLIDPQRLAAMTPEDVAVRLSRFFYDTALSVGPGALDALRSVADEHRILFGSDWPFAPETVTALSVAQMRGTENGAQLFPRLAARAARA
jgi:predicted TIM-barrel fold metal-dependent hydrolase